MSKYLYNGVELPALPEWDKTVYPYAFIYIVTLDGTTGVYTLAVSSSSVMSYDGNGIICPSATVGQRYTVSEDSWAAAAASDDFYIKRDNLIYTVWANFDVLNSDGSVYVAASEPVPVAGKFPLREWVGWLIAGLCSRPLPMSKREPVAYLYNGVRLPPLPEWDRVKYPYAGISTSGKNSYYLRLLPSDAYYKYISSAYALASDSTVLTSNYNPSTNKWNDFFENEGGYISTIKNENLGIGCVWTNFDLKNSNGSVYLTASDPIPVYENTPTAYLYNGVKLAALPEWDKAKYPYAFMWTEGEEYWLEVVPDKPFAHTDENGELRMSFVYGDWYSNHYMAEDKWNPHTPLEGAGCIRFSYLVWSNVDIYNQDDGSLVFAASTPVPASE